MWWTAFRRKRYTRARNGCCADAYRTYARDIKCCNPFHDDAPCLSQATYPCSPIPGGSLPGTASRIRSQASERAARMLDVGVAGGTSYMKLSHHVSSCPQTHPIHARVRREMRDSFRSPRTMHSFATVLVVMQAQDGSRGEQSASAIIQCICGFSRGPGVLSRVWRAVC
ncbi:hypothetical protein BV20DRAFT_860697 [Pilatotrama ljubarskyi]|nr:hypothetical protein BV20DRAFT_860697 [Pilatotrama ljubarskyi]